MGALSSRFGNIAEKYAAIPASLSDIFVEEPVDLHTFVTDQKFLDNPPLSPIQFDAVRHAERIYLPDLYPLMAEEFNSEYWAEPVRMVNFIDLMYGKGCLAPHEEVYDALSGQWCAVKDLGDNEGLVQSLDTEGSKSVVRNRTSSFMQGQGECFRVTTKANRILDVYAGHKFWTWEKFIPPGPGRYERVRGVWKPLREMKVGDRIGLIKKLDCTSPIEIDSAEVELVGLWIGDGCMPKSGSTGLSFIVDPKRKDLVSHYVGLIESYAGVKAKHTVMQSGALSISVAQVKLGDYLHGICVHPEQRHSAWTPYLKRGLCDRHYGIESRAGRLTDWDKVERYSPLNEVVKRYGLYGKRAWDKRVPKEFFSLGDDQLALFLSRLWDTDGSVYFKKSRHNNPTPVCEYSTSSEGLARDVVKLLLRFGIVARLTSKIPSYVYKGEKKLGRRSWRVVFSGASDVLRMCEVLRFSVNRKEEVERAKNIASGMTPSFEACGDVYWDEVKSIESLGEMEYWNLSVEDTQNYVAGAGFINANSGKDTVARCIAMRIAYLLICLKSPQDYFGLMKQDTISMMNVAPSAPVALTAFFNPMVRMASRGWFKDKCDPLRNSISFDKNIEAISGHSDAATQEGLNLILGVADEIDAFKSSETARNSGRADPASNVEEILAMFRTSASSRFPETFKNVRVSYPYYHGSPIMRLIESAKKDIEVRGEKSRRYASGPFATWEVNPNFDKYPRIVVPNSPIPIPNVPVFVTDFEDEPIMARAKYLCQPSRAVTPYFRNVASLDECLIEVEQQPLEVLGYDREGKSWVPDYAFASDFKAVQGAVYAMHGDLAKNGDKAGIAMAHVSRWSDLTSVVVEQDGFESSFPQRQPHVVVDFVVYFDADLSIDPPREIQLWWARALALNLRKRGFNIQMVSFDGYQSLDGMQQLELHGIESKRVSTDVSTEPYKLLKDLFSSARVEIPYSKLLRDELMGLNKLPNGKIDHSPHSSKDLSDAVACAVFGAIKLGGEEAEGSPENFYSSGDIVVGGGLHAEGFGLDSLGFSNEMSIHSLWGPRA
jgi:intein/homing endonuclease